LLRSTSFFDGAGASTAIAVLACWAVVGSLIIVIAMQRRAFQLARGPAISSVEADRLDRLDTQPNLVRQRAVATFRDRTPWRYAPETGGPFTRDPKAG
jgi:hypothetical protein